MSWFLSLTSLRDDAGEIQSTLVQNLAHFAGIGESSRLSLGVHQVPVDDNIKHTAASGNQLCFHTDGLPQLLRQTGGIGHVVSN
jgi:hypothetical protein